MWRDAQLFAGENQYDRYTKSLKKIAKICETDLLTLGINPDELGAHSSRKGSASCCSSGSTAAPSGTAVNIRAKSNSRLFSISSEVMMSQLTSSSSIDSESITRVGNIAALGYPPDETISSGRLIPAQLVPE